MGLSVSILILSLVSLILYSHLVFKREEKGYFIFAIIVSLNMTLFFTASTMRHVLGMDWWLQYFTLGFANEWSRIQYLVISISLLIPGIVLALPKKFIAKFGSKK